MLKDGGCFSISGELQVITGKLPKKAPPWNKILQVIVAIRSVIPEIQNSSDMTKGIILRNCLIGIEHLLPSFISPLLQNTPDFQNDWKSVIEIFNAFQHGNFSRHFEVYDMFEKIVINLLCSLYPVDDCLTGIETIDDQTKYEVQRYGKIYKECYQLFLSFVADLKVQLKQFLDFPFYKMMDETLAEISYEYSKNKFPHLLEKINNIKPLEQIGSVQLATRQYQLFMPELQSLKQMVYTFRKRLEHLYFVQTDVHLLSLPNELYKTPLVYDLFSTDGKC